MGKMDLVRDAFYMALDTDTLFHSNNYKWQIGIKAFLEIEDELNQKIISCHDFKKLYGIKIEIDDKNMDIIRLWKRVY